MIYCGDIEIQSCPVCGNEMELVEEQGLHGIRCNHCDYEYGYFKNKGYMIGAWNALATVFPRSVHMIANSNMKGAF